MNKKYKVYFDLSSSKYWRNSDDSEYTADLSEVNELVLRLNGSDDSVIIYDSSSKSKIVCWGTDGLGEFVVEIMRGGGLVSKVFSKEDINTFIDSFDKMTETPYKFGFEDEDI